MMKIGWVDDQSDAHVMGVFEPREAVPERRGHASGWTLRVIGGDQTEKVSRNRCFGRGGSDAIMHIITAAIHDVRRSHPSSLRDTRESEFSYSTSDDAAEGALYVVMLSLAIGG
jgi:hypothetical protein